MSETNFYPLSLTSIDDDLEMVDYGEKDENFVGCYIGPTLT